MLRHTDPMLFYAVTCWHCACLMLWFTNSMSIQCSDILTLCCFMLRHTDPMLVLCSDILTLWPYNAVTYWPYACSMLWHTNSMTIQCCDILTLCLYNNVHTDLMLVQGTKMVVPEEDTQLVFLHGWVEFIQSVVSQLWGGSVQESLR